MSRLRRPLALLAILLATMLTGCAAVERSRSLEMWQPVYTTDGRETGMKRIDLSDGTSCYWNAGEFSCLVRVR